MARSERILAVDDNSANLVLLSLSLEKAGYEVLTARDGTAAVKLAREARPDLILLDLLMPGMDGLEVCRTLKSEAATSSIPIIFVTGQTHPTTVVQAFSAGGNDYITKPLCVEETLARVSGQLRLRHAERKLVEGNAQLEALAEKLRQANRQLSHQARVDPLTGLLNRGAWERAVREELHRSQRYGHTDCIVMIDIDHFKAFNDTRGHPAGDQCLRSVARCIAQTCRDVDVVGRYGGEEFAVLAPETQLTGALELAERIRQAVWDGALQHTASPAGRVTVSLGVAGGSAASFETLLREADAALYRAKTGGRNLVTAYQGGMAGVSAASAGQHAQDAGGAEDHSRVLLAGLEGGLLKRCRAALSETDCRVEVVDEACQPVPAATAAAFDLIVFDLVATPTAAAHVRTLKSDPQTRRIPLLCIGGAANGADIVGALKAGADDYLAQPFRAAEFALRVGALASLHRERRDLLRSHRLRSEQIRVLTLLLDYCRALEGATTSDEVFRLTAAAAAEATGSQRACVLAPDAGRRVLTIVGATGLERRATSNLRVALGEGVTGAVFGSRQPVVFNSRDDAVAAGASRDEAEVLAGVPLFCGPLSRGDEVHAVLCVCDRIATRPFGPRDLETIALISDVAGATLNRLASWRARDEARDLTIAALARLAENHDNKAGGHVERVTEYSRILAEQLRGHARVDDEFVRDLVRAVPLHDIGQIAVPDGILHKPGRLTLEEMTIMRTHVAIGAEALRPVIEQTGGVRFMELAAEIVQAHHEWFDGSGYPGGIAGQEIPLSARIVALADVYDALTSPRVYRKAIGHEQAVRIIRDSSGTQFDPDVVEAFLKREGEIAAVAARLADSDAGAADPSTNGADQTRPAGRRTAAAASASK